MSDKSLPPSERAEKQEKQQKEREALAAQKLGAMREDFTKTFQTAHGKRVLAWIFERAGFGKVILSANARTGEFDQMATMFAAMELNFYLEMRKHIDIATLQEVEYGRVKPTGFIAPDDSDNTSQNKRSTSKSKSAKKGK